MRKLKTALTLLFAMSFSLFLFACGGGSNPDVKKVTIGVGTAKVEYTDQDEATAFSAEGITVTATYNEKDENGKDVKKTLEADQYEVDASAVVWGTVGEYEIVVTPKDQNPEAVNGIETGTYTITIEHNYQTSGDWEVCPKDNVKRQVKTLNETITTVGWGNQAEITADSFGTAPKAGENHVSYGTISVGQTVTLKGEIVDIDTSAAWNTPLMGFRNGAAGILPREDGWCINVAAGFTTPDGKNGYGMGPGTASEENLWTAYANGDTWSATAMEGAKITFVYNYTTDGVISITHILTETDGTTTKQTISVAVPLASYEIVAYGEKCTYKINEYSIVKNLSVIEDEVKLAKKTGLEKAYGEYSMLDVENIELSAKYSGGAGMTVPNVTTYNIYADVVDGDNVTIYDLRKAPLTTAMTNFRAEFEGVTITLPAPTVVASKVNKVASAFADATATYGVVDGKTSVIVSGKATNISDVWGVGLVVGNDQGIVYSATPVQSEDVSACKINDDTIMLSIVVDANVIANGVDATVDGVALHIAFVDFAIPEAYVAYEDMNNTVSLDGGDVVLTYKGITLNDNLTFWMGNGSKKWSAFKDDMSKAPTSGKLAYIKNVQEVGGDIVVTYHINEFPYTAQTLVTSFEVSIADGSNKLAVATIGYDFTIDESATEIAEGVYVIVAEKTLYVIYTKADEYLANFNANVALNVQNEAAEAFDLSIAVENGVASLTAVNTLTKKAVVRQATFGTFNNAYDIDSGFIAVAKVDISALELDTDKEVGSGYYYFEVAGEGDVYKVSFTTVEGKREYAIEAVENLEGAQDQSIVGDCLVDNANYKVFNGFKFAKTGSASGVEHNFVEGVCANCGSVQYGATTTTGMEVAAINKDLVTRGFTMSFIVNGATNDWASAFLTTKNNYILTLPNIDPWNNTDTDATYKNDNFFPGKGATMTNGAEWNTFLNPDRDHVNKAYVTVTISTSAGITYYLNGVKMIQYKANLVIGGGTMGGLAEKILTAIATEGFTFAAGAEIGRVANLSVYSAWFNDAQVAAEALKPQTSNTADMDGNFTSTKEWGWTDTFAIVKGTKLILTGMQDMNDESATVVAENYHTIYWEFTQGWTERGDIFGWSFGDKAIAKDDTQSSCSTTGADVVEFWADAKTVFAHCTWTLTLDWTGDMLEVKYVAVSTKADLTFTYNSAYTTGLSEVTVHVCVGAATGMTLTITTVTNYVASETDIDVLYPVKEEGPAAE